MSRITIENAAFASYNEETGMVRFNVNENVKEVSFVMTTSMSSSLLKETTQKSASAGALFF